MGMMVLIFLFPSIVFILGVVCLVWAIKWHSRIKNYQQTTGIVISNNWNLTYELEYTDENKDTHIKKLRIHSRAEARRKKVGNKLNIIYDQRNPQQVHSKLQAYKNKYLLFVLGCLIIFFSLASGAYLFSLGSHFQDIQQDIKQMNI